MGDFFGRVAENSTSECAEDEGVVVKVRGDGKDAVDAFVQSARDEGEQFGVALVEKCAAIGSGAGEE